MKTKIILVVSRREYRVCLSVFGAYEYLLKVNLENVLRLTAFVNIGVQKLHQKQMLPATSDCQDCGVNFNSKETKYIYIYIFILALQPIVGSYFAAL